MAASLSAKAPPAVISPVTDGVMLALSIILQAILGLFLSHLYDMRLFMAAGYMVGHGLDPYLAQDLSTVFSNDLFHGITTIGYPPPWPLILGLLYRLSFGLIPNLLVYNLAIKLPIIAANICLAYLMVHMLRKLEVSSRNLQSYWIFMLFNPFILYATAAWGQIDSIVALFALLALDRLSEEKLYQSAILLALAVTFKPTAFPIILAALVYLRPQPLYRSLSYLAVLGACVGVLFVAPFLIFGWSPAPIIHHWNAHFMQAGGLSYMTFLELLQGSYILPGPWWFVGWLWVPIVGAAALLLVPGGTGLPDILRKSTILVLAFFVSRSWLSEPNIILLLPLLLMLSAAGKLDKRLLVAAWVIPLVFSIVNTGAFQLLFPSQPILMNRLLLLADSVRTARLIARIIVVIPWLLTAGWITASLFRQESRARSSDNDKVGALV